MVFEFFGAEFLPASGVGGFARERSVADFGGGASRAVDDQHVVDLVVADSVGIQVNRVAFDSDVAFGGQFVLFFGGLARFPAGQSHLLRGQQDCGLTGRGRDTIGVDVQSPVIGGHVERSNSVRDVHLVGLTVDL